MTNFLDRPTIIVLFLLMIIVLMCFFFTWVRDGDVKAIHNKVDSIGGTVVSVEYRSLRTGPFWVLKNARTYKFIYKVNDTEKEGWVQFLWGPHWNFEYKEK